MEILTKKEINYPETDGKPMAESTLQFQWLTLIKFGLEATFREDENVFVAGDLFWYPAEGYPGICYAPDVMVVQGRPKGHRGSYMQWKEDNIPPQVVIEIISKGNRFGEMMKKFRFYERYGVQEYYIYDPERNELEGWLRENDELQPVSDVDHFLSPLLRIRFERTEDILNLYHPDGKPFVSYLEIFDKNEQYVAQLAAQQELLQAESERANAEKTRADKLALRLQELGIDPDTI